MRRRSITRALADCSAIRDIPVTTLQPSNDAACRACDEPRHAGMSCVQARLMMEAQAREEKAVVVDEPSLSTPGDGADTSVISHTHQGQHSPGYARLLRWRKAHPGKHRSRHAEYMRRWRERYRERSRPPVESLGPSLGGDDIPPESEFPKSKI